MTSDPRRRKKILERLEAEAFHCEKVLSHLDIKRAKALRALILRMTAVASEGELSAAYADAEMIVLAMDENVAPSVPPPPRRSKSAVGVREAVPVETRREMAAVRGRSRKS